MYYNIFLKKFLSCNIKQQIYSPATIRKFSGRSQGSSSNAGSKRDVVNGNGHGLNDQLINNNLNNPLLEEALMLSESPRVTRRKRGSFSEFDTNGDMVMPSSPFGRRRSRNPPDVGNQRDTNELFKVISQDESRERNPSLGNLGMKMSYKIQIGYE